MKKFFTATACAAAALAAAETVKFPLEWNRNYNTDTPYEVEIDRSKLSEISGASADCGFKIIAVANGRSTHIPAVLLKGENDKLTALRFKVPAGTEKLECEVSGKGVLSCVKENLFDGVLAKENLKKWQLAPKTAISSTKDGVLLRYNGSGVCSAMYTVDVPDGFAGKPVKLEFDVKSHTPIPWGNNNRIEQLDANGKLIPEGAVRQEWISHMRPHNVLTRYREKGRIHPDAKKLRLVIRLSSRDPRKKVYGLDGLPLKNLKDTKAALEISHLVLRSAAELPFPKYNDSFFAPGVSGRADDFAIRLSRDTHFSHNTASQAVWGDAFQVKDPKQLFFPIGESGTVEFHIKPDKWKYARRNTVVLIDAYNVIGTAGRQSVPRRNTIFELKYRPVRKLLTLTLKDGKDRVFTKSTVAEIAFGKWSHIAAQWSKDGVQIFVNGKRVLNDPDFKFAPLDIANMQFTNGYIPMQVTLGTTTPKTRNAGTYSQAASPDFCGLIDLLRHSDIARYKGDFTPQTSFTADENTRALLCFDRSFEGVSGGGIRHLKGAVRAKVAMTDRYLEINGKKKPYLLLKNLPHNDPAKVLDKVNYPVTPSTRDFHAARSTELKKLTMTAGKCVEFTLPQDVITDYVEIVNTSKTQTLHSPVVINDGEVDTRSFADIAESLKLEGKSDRQKVEDLFRFVLARSDYFMTHQTYIPNGNDYPTIVENYSHTMLNAYCGFECGPLNNLASALFTCSGKVPSRMIGAYAHAYEGVFFNGKTRVYDLSAQQFFPSWDNTNAATQDEIDYEVGLMEREGKNPNHFMRLTTRGGQYVNSAALLPKAGVMVKPLERLRIYDANNGIQNDLQCDRRVNSIPHRIDKTEETGTIVGSNRMYRIDRFFPHVSTGFINLDCTPAQNRAAFCNVKKQSFCYRVSTSFPIVRGTYSAYDKNGKPVKMTFITNKGKRKRSFGMTADGKYDLDYEIRARHELLFRVEAPISSVAKFSAETQFVMNPRIFTGKLRKGSNKLLFKEVNNSSAEVTIAYRKYVRDITVEGGVYSGGIPGHERQLFAAEPGKTLTLSVNGASDKAKILTFGNIRASLSKGKLSVTPEAGNTRFSEVVIDDNGAKKSLTFIVGKGVKLLTAKDFTPGKNSSAVKADNYRVQDCVMLNDNGVCTVKFPSMPAGKYAIWNLNRFESHIASVGLAKRPLMMQISGSGKPLEAGSAINHASDFYKAQFNRPGQRGRFKWDFPIDPATKYWAALPHIVETKEFSELKFNCRIPNYKGIEIAAILIVPDPSTDLRNDMVKILCGLNCEPFLREK
ncbi:MAG: LamG domain-containing protein [Lentisphaerae bacterium]|nr:LamG domain-containing protein [Lentisphaerota bacterium]